MWKSATSCSVLRDRLRNAALFLCCLLLASCFEIREEAWIYSDGSGRANLRATIPLAATRMHGGEAGVRKIIGDFLTNTPEIDFHQLETSVVENDLHIDLRTTFKNAMKLSELTNGEAAEELPTIFTKFMGITTVSLDGLSIDFHRQLDLGKAIPGSSFIPASQLRDRHITTIIHLPKPAATQNATEVKNDGHTLIWKTPLSKALRQPVDARFTMPLPIPWGLVTGAAGGILLVLAVAVHFMIRRRKPRRARALG